MKQSSSLFKDGEFQIKINLSDEQNLTANYVLIIKLTCSPKSDLQNYDNGHYFDDDAPIAYIDHIDMVGKNLH